MGRYIIRRVLWILVLMILITLITYLMFYLLPSTDPARLRLGRNPGPDPEARLAVIRHQLGLDKAWYVQYWTYVKNLVWHFDFGHTYTQDNDVRSLLFARIPNTLFLVTGAAILWLFSGLVIGSISAVKRGSAIDRIAMGSALVAISAPVYWLGLVTLYLFADDIGIVKIFPGVGSYQDAHGFFAKIPTLILPWLVLAAAFTAIYARLMRGNMIEVLSEDYIRTARAKGLTERVVIVRHAARSALTPVVTVFGIDVGVLMGGAILTETVFNIPGVGRLSYEAIQRNDLPTIQGTVVFLALGVCVMSLVVDILYAFLDPRVRY
jgi:peptide/nickel transport system permease protein